MHSPAANFHNRFALQQQQAAQPTQGQAQASTSAGDSKDAYAFLDFKAFDGDSLSSFPSYLSSPPQSANPPLANPPPANPPPAAMETAADAAPAWNRQSRDVAALEAAVAAQEEQEQGNTQPDAASSAAMYARAAASPPSIASEHSSGRERSVPRVSTRAQGGAAPRPPSASTAASSSTRNPLPAPPAMADDPARSSASMYSPPSVSSHRPGSSQAGSNMSHAQGLPQLPQSAQRQQQQQQPPVSFPAGSSSGHGSAGSGPHDASQYYAAQQQQQRAAAARAGVPVEELESMGIADEDGGEGAKLDGEGRSRPSSFFGMARPVGAVNAAGQAGPLPNEGGRPLPDNESVMTRGRPSSFFGVQGHVNSNAGGPLPGTETGPNGQSQAARIAALHRSEMERRGPSPGVSSAGISSAAPAGVVPQQSQMGGLGATGAARPASIAPSVATAPLLDHSHLRPGQQAALLSHNKTLELYRQNAKKTNDPNLIYEFAVFMIDASKSMGGDDSSGGSGGPSGSGGAQGKEETAREELVREAVGLLKKIAERGHPDAQYFLADCYANGIGSPKGKQDFDRAYPLFVLAAKHGHPDAAYRAGTCYEKGWGCRRDAGKALQFYRKAASASHPGAMYRLATAELNGELGLKKSAREGVKWLKRSAEAATPEFPHALHELALLHERGVDNVLFVDHEYACELLAQGGEMGYAPSAYKLGVNYEYGRMGCPQDAGLSIHMYNIAAQQNHKEACFALTAWYLVGAPGILPQSDTEAYLWAKKAAEQGLAKAEYAVGYFTEMGIGTVKDLNEARAWYRAAAQHGDKRANQRLAAFGAVNGNLNQLAGIGAQVRPTAAAQGAAIRAAQGPDYAALPQSHRTQPPNAPFPSAVDTSSMSPAGAAGPTNYPSPMAMRDAQTAAREQAFQVRAGQVAAQRNASGGAPLQGGPMMPPPPVGYQSQYPQQPPQQRPPQAQAYPSYAGAGSPPPPQQGQQQHFGGPQSPPAMYQAKAPPAMTEPKKKGWFGR